MTPFPVTASTLSETGLASFAVEKYGLNKHSSCKLVRTGINHTYFIHEQENIYVLRVYSFLWRSKEEIREEIELLTFLKENKLSISHPIADVDGKYIQEVNAPEGVRYAVLFSYAKGGKVRFMKVETCEAVGALMGQIHELTANKKVERMVYNNNTLFELPYQYAKRIFSEQLPEMEFLRETSHHIAQTFERVNQRLVQSGTVHLDIWYDNMSITDNSEITIFDFDFCGNGFLVLDVAYYCMQLFQIENDKTEYETKVKHFLKGYQSIRKLSKEEIELIPQAGATVWFFYLGVQCYRFDWSNIFLTENYLKMYIGRIRTWLEYYKDKHVMDL